MDKWVGPYGCIAAVAGAGPFALTIARSSPGGAVAIGGAEGAVTLDLRTAVAVSMLSVSRQRACAAFKELRDRDPYTTITHVIDALRIPPEQRSRLEDLAWARTDAALVSGAAAGMEVIAWFDTRYSALLNCIDDPPPVLWTRGDVGVLARPAVAVVGSRAATTYALDVGARLGGELAHRGIVVASGLARGVDSAAHRGCLDAAGPTVAVLGSGLDRIYPAEHEDLAELVAKKGVLVSELGPGATPAPEHFPLRNRIISGISLAVVVVEASEKSGSLITARCALEQGRDVMAVPGSILTGRNRGSHSLLKDGAKVVETADDILDELGWPGALAPVESSKRLFEDPLLAAIEAGEVYRLEDLVEKTGISPAKLLPRLMELELQGHVAGAAGGRFTRLSRRQ